MKNLNDLIPAMFVISHGFNVKVKLIPRISHHECYTLKVTANLIFNTQIEKLIDYGYMVSYAKPSLNITKKYL